MGILMGHLNHKQNLEPMVILILTLTLIPTLTDMGENVPANKKINKV